MLHPNISTSAFLPQYQPVHWGVELPYSLRDRTYVGSFFLKFWHYVRCFDANFHLRSNNRDDNNTHKLPRHCRQPGGHIQW